MKDTSNYIDQESFELLLYFFASPIFPLPCSSAIYSGPKKFLAPTVIPNGFYVPAIQYFATSIVSINKFALSPQ